MAPEPEKEKRTHGLKGKRKSVLHRLRISQGRTGKRHSPETREKIRQSMLKFRRSQKQPPQQQREPSRQEIFSGLKPPSKGKGRRNRVMDDFVMEKAVLEMSQLRKEVAVWLDGWYAHHEHKPSLDDVAQFSPEIHNKFLRYIALQEFIRSNS